MWSKKLFLITLVGGFLRFYKLDWGEGYFFHPDEYHIAAAVNRLSFPSQMNPEFFSYGSFIIYLNYFTKLILTILISKPLSLNPILIGRFYSAFFSTLTVIIIFFISRSYLAAFLAAITPGLIQQAHFATPESILTFWLFLTLFLWLKYWEEKKVKFLYLSAVCLGLSIGTKITGLIFLPILILLPLRVNTSKVAKQRPRLLRGEYLIKALILPLLIVALTFLFVSPYTLLDWQDFRSSMDYETGVGRGEPVVFYTRQFIKTTPVLFQFQKIFPYALGPGILILGVLGLLTSIKECFKEKRRLLVVLAFFSYFLPNAFLFAKWTRFIAPAFPFFAIFTAYLLNKIKKNKFLVSSFCFLVFINFLWTLMFFSIYLRPEVRITATAWINQNLPSDSFILTEAGNMLEAPLKGSCQKRSFDFYHLEENPALQGQLPELLASADYFIIQSRRIFINHQRLPDQFPKTNRFYQQLFSGQLGFEKIKEFNSYPSLVIGHWSLVIPDEVGEETWSVFDHPVIRIYKKIKPFSKERYESLLKI